MILSGLVWHGITGPKPDALPGCATPRLAETLRFRAIQGQALMLFRGNKWRNVARTGVCSPGIVPNRIGLALIVAAVVSGMGGYGE